MRAGQLACDLVFTDVRVYNTGLSAEQVKQLATVQPAPTSVPNCILDDLPLHWWVPGHFAPVSTLCPSRYACLKDLGRLALHARLIDYPRLAVESDCPYGGCFRITSCLSFVESIATVDSTITGSSPKTIAAWVKVGSFSGNGDGIVPLLGFGADGKSFQMFLSQGKLRLGSPSNSVGLDRTLSIGTWHHVAATYNGTHAVLFQDGVGSAFHTLFNVTATAVMFGAAGSSRACSVAFTDLALLSQCSKSKRLSPVCPRRRLEFYW